MDEHGLPGGPGQFEFEFAGFGDDPRLVVVEDDVAGLDFGQGPGALAPVPVVPEGCVLEDHAVVVEDDRIAAVVPIADLASRFPGVEPPARRAAVRG